ncbi:MAG: GSCFA domain-containing protein [Algoriphagus sp.]|nr:GSCFA domain-containing protein [Algoriphagus sp.]
MQWSTEISIPKSPFPISHSSKILSMGSCFAQTMGKKMEDSKLDALVNPFGTIFHPIAIADLLEAAISGNHKEENLILERGGLYFHYSAHSDLVGNSKEELLEKLNTRIELAGGYLKTGTHLILTFGTAWVYELKETQTLVANCHKQPSELFKKRLLSLEEMKVNMGNLFSKLSDLNPSLNIVLTVSPVRHIKDGIQENQLSKSLLRVLSADLENEFENVSYFPAYEIMMDELRDYRFYKSDLIHPSEQAEIHIWQKWKDAFFTPLTQKKVNQISKINLALNHRPLSPKSEGYHKFLQNLLQKLEQLNSEFDFSKEIETTKLTLEEL